MKERQSQLFHRLFVCPRVQACSLSLTDECLVVSTGFRSILNDEKLTAKIEQKEHTWALIFVATEIDDIP